VDFGSGVSLQKAVDNAQSTDTLVYSILYIDPAGYGRRWNPSGVPLPVLHCGRPTLRHLSGETFFEASKRRRIEDVYDRIQYILVLLCYKRTI
jgi:hypothetical protein